MSVDKGSVLVIIPRRNQVTTRPKNYFGKMVAVFIGASTEKGLLILDKQAITKLNLCMTYFSIKAIIL